VPMKPAPKNWRVLLATSRKRRNSAKLAAQALCLVILAVPAFAWNDEGHMAIAYLAYQRLAPATRARVNALLKLNPYYSKWRAALPAGTSEADADRMIFMIAATWPDQIRNDRAYMDDGPNHGNSPPNGPEAARNIGYADHQRHKYWHFIDIPYSQDGTKLPAVAAPNAETQIAAFRQALGSNASDDVKSYDLSWLEHLVGDIHQPLHAITRVSKSMPDGDAGGGLDTLCASPCSNSLHWFWDRLVGSQSGIEDPGRHTDLATEVRSAMSAAKALPAADSATAAKKNEHVWVQESFDLAKQYVYVSPVGPGAGPFTLNSQYYAAAKRVAEQRVALAGARLGNLLNRELN
jgi:hypothetical protein